VQHVALEPGERLPQLRVAARGDPELEGRIEDRALTLSPERIERVLQGDRPGGKTVVHLRNAPLGQVRNGRTDQLGAAAKVGELCPAGNVGELGDSPGRRLRVPVSHQALDRRVEQGSPRLGTALRLGAAPGLP
jgi:hypothetical protein